MALPKLTKAGARNQKSAVEPRSVFRARDPGSISGEVTGRLTRPCRRWSTAWRAKKALRRVKKIGNAHIFEAVVAPAPPRSAD